MNTLPFFAVTAPLLHVDHRHLSDTGWMLFCVLADLSISLCSVYSGHQSILIPPSELETNPALWLLAVSQYKVRDTFCSYSVMELCTKGLGSQTESLKVSSPAPLTVPAEYTQCLGKAVPKGMKRVW